MDNVLLSVVIPTHGRPFLLEKAICSALESSIENNVEVIVVPNGEGSDWISVSDKFSNNRKVIFLQCKEGNGNAARNVGLRAARGKYIRFLDDDDYFYSENASLQLREMIESEADVSSGMIEIIDSAGLSHGLCTYPLSEDFITANLKVSGITLPTANIYKKSIINNVWDEKITRAQDYIFILDFIIQKCNEKNIHWHRFNKAIGIWYQHNEYRVSSSHGKRSFLSWNFERVVELYYNLIENGNLNESRKFEVSVALWRFIENSYGLDRSLCMDYANFLFKENLKENKIAENLNVNKKIKCLIRKKPMYYIRVKWLFLHFFGGVRARLKSKEIIKV
ncbi:glycosyltransferase family 2 protein [Tatumella sp. TA1]|nr:glycosyltransferase family 2 protein [Tatumella sp. TA1]